MSYATMLPERTVTVRCPCCGHGSVEVVLVQGSYPEDPMGWSVDDCDPTDCDCYDYMERAPRRVQGGEAVATNPMPEHYREAVEERALGVIR